MNIKFILNGMPVETGVAPNTPLINVLRDDFGLFGTRFGCGQESCGACKVLVDGKPSFSCALVISEVASHVVQTVEGLGSPENPHPLQKAFLAEQAGQCGYCLSGMLIESAALLAENCNPSEEDIRTALQGNLCRCGVHNRIIRGVLSAANEMRLNANSKLDEQQ